MRKIADRLTAILLASIILVFGGGTALKVKGPVLDIVRSEAISEMPAAIEAALTEKFKSRNNWINVNGLFQRLIGVTVIRDAGDIDVFKMSNGQLTYEYPDCDMDYAAKEVTGLSKFCEDRDIDFMYVQLPCKAYSDDLMPPGTHTYGYADSDEIISSIKEKGVQVLDLREEIEREGFDIPGLFFNTDHHWKPSTALWAAGVISEELAKTVDGYDYDRAIYDRDNYKTKVYEDWFLGSLGRRVGSWYGGVDDFEVITPRFNTDFHLYTESQTSEGKKKNKDGSFKKALMKLQYVKNKDYFSVLTYFTYMGNEYRLATVTNRMADNDKKILMLRDSFSCTLLPYLSLSAGEITAIDMRYHDKIKIKDYIKDNDFDAVIIAYNPSMFREDGAFDFDR